MTTPTTELLLPQCQDSDDEGDYLTVALPSALRTVDGLFSATGGHTHSGAHQGGAIAPGAVTHLSAVYGSSSSPTTTSTTAVLIPDMTLPISCPVDCLLRIDFEGTFVITVGSGFYQIVLQVDGVQASAGQGIVIMNAPVSQFVHSNMHGYIGATAGPHTIQALWLVSAGTTVQSYSVYRALSVLEIRA